MSDFAIIRLGKDSVSDIKKLNALRKSPEKPVNLTVRCAQVPQELKAGDYAFICLGSDNNKGIATEWTRGVRALGKVTRKSGGPGYNDQWNLSVEIRVVLPESVTQKDLLAKAPRAYYWCSDIPVLGVDTHSNQTAQMIREEGTHQKVAALVSALTTIFPEFRSDTISAYPDLASLFDYQPPAPEGKPITPATLEPFFAEDNNLIELIKRFSFDARSSDLNVQQLNVHRLVASLLSKRFLIAAGLAGSGKTQLALAFARWLTHTTTQADPFLPGTTIESERVTYVVKKADSVAIEFWNESGEEGPTKNMVPREVISEWANYIESNKISSETSAQDISDVVEKSSQFSAYLHRFRPFLKQAAFALIKARASGQPSKRFEIIPVGADWTGSENVLGYPSGLDSGSYLAKPALDLILQAHAHPGIPHFLILDEMNLSHVERYFADILSAIESEEEIPLHGEEERKAGGRVIPQKLGLPKNLFIVGTVNVDETTYMFSPKVLDRANVIEFRMDEGELKAFLGNPAKPDLARLDGKGAGFCKAFADAAGGPAVVPEEAREPFEREMELFFRALQGHGAEFGYRVAHEAARFAHFYKALGNRPGEEDWFPAAFDCIIVQKFLPKLHGSRAKLGPLLKKLWFLCLNEAAALGADALKAAEEAARSTDRKAEPTTDPDILAGARYPLSAEKIGRMWRLLNENGFASFAEA